MTDQARPDTAALFVERLAVHLAALEAADSPANELRFRLAQAMATADVQDAYGAFEKLFLTADRIRDAFASLHGLLDGLEDQIPQDVQVKLSVLLHVLDELLYSHHRMIPYVEGIYAAIPKVLRS